MAQSRTLFAWLSVFMVDGRTVKSEPSRSLKAWRICAYIMVTT